jgi:hypothetical protein
LSVALTVPHASADSSYQPALDQLLDAMQQAANYDAALPFATPDSDAMLLTGLQNTNYELLSAGLSRVTELFNGVFFQSPEAVAGDAADSRQYFQFFTPDIYYTRPPAWLPVRPTSSPAPSAKELKLSPSRPKQSPVQRL